MTFPIIDRAGPRGDSTDSSSESQAVAVIPTTPFRRPDDVSAEVSS